MSSRPTVLITGATAGIGLALAKRLARDFSLVLCGRRDKALCVDLLPKGARYVQADFENPTKAADIIAAFLAAERIDTLHRVIVNAGTGYYGPMETESTQRVRQTLDVNLTAPILLASRLAPLLENGRGKLVLIGSTAHRGAANMPSYAASKAGLAGLARSLSSEWRDRIDLQIIHPGPTATEMHEKAGYHAGRYRRLFFPPADMAEEIVRLMETKKAAATVSVAARLRGLFRRRPS